MTNQDEQVYPYYRSPASIRGETFAHRMRGLDEDEVREYLDLLADQVQAADHERAELRAENQSLMIEVQRVRAELAERPNGEDLANDQVVALFSQAQLVAEEMVEEVTRSTRERMMQARAQEREILQEALESAEATRRQAEAELRSAMPATFGRDNGRGDLMPAPAPGSAGAELEHVRSFARIAQTQMQSIMDALAAQVERLGHEAPSIEPPTLTPHFGSSRSGNHGANHDGDGSTAAHWRTWQTDVSRDRQDPWASG